MTNEISVDIIIALFSGAIAFLLGCWAGIGSEKARIKNMEKMALRVVDYYNKMKLAIPVAEKLVSRIEPRYPPAPFPPGPLAELYNEKDIEEVLTSVNKSFPDRMKAAKAAKRKT